MFDFDDETLDWVDEAPSGEPVIVAFHTGGLYLEDGQKSFRPLLEAAARRGLGDSLVLGYPDHYGFLGTDEDDWPKYVSKLIEEIDAHYAGRPLLLVSHGRGVFQSMSLATRLGLRVLKMYVFGRGPILGEEIGENRIQTKFNEYGVRGMLEWFDFHNPGNGLLKKTLELPPDKFDKTVRESPWLARTLKIMRLHYVDVMWPRMVGPDAAIQIVTVPIMVFVAAQDPECTMAHNTDWPLSTTNNCKLLEFDANHMNILQSHCGSVDVAAQDMQHFVRDLLPEAQGLNLDGFDEMGIEGAPEGRPVIVAFHTGGFTYEDGKKLLDPLLEDGAQKGLINSLVLGHPYHYGFESEGYDEWPAYISMLVKAIDAKFSGRPLLLVAHGLGALACMSLATRLGNRVLKVYVFGQPAIEMGRPTVAELDLGQFKRYNEQELLQWLSTQQPGNLMMKRIAELPPIEFALAIAQSPTLSRTLKIVRLQWRDPMYPKMVGPDAMIKVIKAPIMVFVASLDPHCQFLDNVKWEQATMRDCEFQDFSVGHMDILQEFSVATEDMVKFL